MSSRFKVIFWDFDGVLMDSNAIRHYGFVQVLKDFPSSQVNKMLDFHRRNGGLSRYVKFKYFFEEIRGEETTDEMIMHWAAKFSEIMLVNLIDPGLLINETIDFVRSEHRNYIMHIVSGSDEKELRKICEKLEIGHFFNSIHGSPTPKVDLVRELIAKNRHELQDCVLIGDSINDYDAAKNNNIAFFGFGNQAIASFSNTVFNLH